MKSDFPLHFKGLRAVGPGTIMTLLAVLCIASWQLLAPKKVKIERQISPSGTTISAAYPSADELLKWKNKLELNNKQINSIACIELEEKNALSPLEDEIEIQTEAFNTWIKKQNGLSFAQIQAAAKPVSELGFRKRQIRTAYSRQAFELLLPKQKLLAQTLKKEKPGPLKSIGRAEK